MKKYDVAAYVWPAYTGDEPRARIFRNEWTETGYLQPDNLYGYGYLEAVREVFLTDDEE